MNGKRMEEWYSKFLGVMEEFKKNPYVHAGLSVGANDTGEDSYHYSLNVYVWKRTERSIKVLYTVGVDSWSKMTPESKKAWAAIKRLMK